MLQETSIDVVIFFYVVQLLFLVYITFDVASALISDVTTIIFSVTTNRSMKKI